MVNLQKSGDSAVKFVFTDSDHYLYGNGEIEVPVNGLLLVIDESDMVTFKKLSGDPFLSFRADNSNLGTKAAIEQFYKDNMVGSTGGGSGSGVTPSEVQEMIDESISGKADTSDVTAVANDVQTVSGQVATKVATTDFNAYSATTDARIAEDEEVTAAALNNLDETKQDALEYYSEDTENKSAEILITNDDGEGSTGDNHFNIGGGVAEIGIYNEYDDGQGNVTSNNSFIYADQTMVNLQAGVTENGDTTSTDLSVESTGVTINGDAVATEPYVDAAISGKVDTSAITTSITSGSTDSQVPSAKATYDAITAATTGGGATYSAGTNISIDTANTINCTLPIEKVLLRSWSEDGQQCLWIKPSSVKIWIDSNRPSTTFLDDVRPAFSFGLNYIKGNGNSAAFGQMNRLNGYDNFATGDYNNTNNNYEFATGAYNNSVNDSTASGQTLFSVGNGTSSARHNAFEIRQNGDIYVNDGTNDVRLQDTILALGGLKFVKLTQSEYDNLPTKDNDTLYIISNVVS